MLIVTVWALLIWLLASFINIFTITCYCCIVVSKGRDIGILMLMCAGDSDEDIWHGRMGRRFPDGGVAEIQKMSPSTTGRCSRHAADQWERSTATRQTITTLLIFLVWSTGPLLNFFGRPDGKLFLSFLPIIP